MFDSSQKTTNLSVLTLDQGSFDLSSENSRRGTMLCFYRGLYRLLYVHYFKKFQAPLNEFSECGVGTISISSYVQECTKHLAKKIGADSLILPV